MRINLKTYYFLIYLALLESQTSCGQSGDTNSWKSEYHSLAFTYTNPWTLLPSLDTKKETLAGVIDLSDGKSYIVRIGEDVPKEKLSDQAYFCGVVKSMLAPNLANKLVFEGDTIVHSQPFHRLDFIMKTEKWGWMKQVNVVSRDGQKYFSIQILYPIIPDEGEKAIPNQIVQFDKFVLLNNK